MSARRDTRRRLEQWLANPTCEANAVSAVAGVPMADVARAEGLEPTMGQSPFAIARGVTFEAALFRDDAKALREELARVGVPGGEVPGLLDLRLRMNGGPIADQETASTKTREWLHAAASDPRSVAPLVASATLKVPGQPNMLPDGVLAIDALRLHPLPPDFSGGVRDNGWFPEQAIQIGADRCTAAVCHAAVHSRTIARCSQVSGETRSARLVFR